MTCIGIISDAHGNLSSFKEVLTSMNKKGVERWLYCGDICGYYYHQNEIIRLLRKLPNLVCILGNHDKLFLDMLDGENDGKVYTEKYGHANKLFLETASAECITFLRKMEQSEIFEINGCEIAMFHGSPWDPLDEYIYPDSSFERFKSLNYDFVVLGHTHRPMDITAGRTRIINPGSCGQPRDIDMPSYCIFDTENDSVQFIRVNYDKTALIKEINKNDGTNKYLRDVLQRGASK